MDLYARLAALAARPGTADARPRLFDLSDDPD